jgi:hypothetical protein
MGLGAQKRGRAHVCGYARGARDQARVRYTAIRRRNACKNRPGVKLEKRCKNGGLRRCDNLRQRKREENFALGAVQREKRPYRAKKRKNGAKTHWLASSRNR